MSRGKKVCFSKELKFCFMLIALLVGAINAEGICRLENKIYGLSEYAKKGIVNKEQVKDTIRLADPTIFVDSGIYYLYGTSSDKGFEVYQSTDLKNWKGPVGRNTGYALLKGSSFGNQGFWAPQVFKHKETYYMAYTADEQIAIAKSDSPLGPFKQEKLMPLSAEGKQIDPFVFFDSDGTIYLYHVKLKDGNQIYVSEMKPDLSDLVLGSTRACVYAELPWENTERAPWPVIEGASVTKHKNLYYLIYSANDFRSKDYAIGYATASSPIGPWKKYSGNPIISREKLKHNGTGHGDLFIDKSGNYQYVMHTHFSATKVSPRLTGIIGIAFIKDSSQEPDVIKAKESSFKLLATNNNLK